MPKQGSLMKNMILAAMIVSLLPVPALAQDVEMYAEEDVYVEEVASPARDGLRIEGRVWYERIGDPEEDVIYELGSGVAFGGEVGYDVAVSDTVVVGPFVGYDFSTAEDCDGGFCVGSNGYLTAGVHAGVATGENAQAYVKAGYSSLSVYATGTVNGVPIDATETGGGYEFAFGYEQGFGKNAYGRVEIGIGEAYDIFGFDFQRSHIGVAIGTRF